MATMAKNYENLKLACRDGDLKKVELCLMNYVDFKSVPNNYRDTPLDALFFGLRVKRFTDLDVCYKITRLLVSHGDRLNRYTMSIILSAINYANLDTVKLLVNEANGDLRYVSTLEGASCLHAAVLCSQPGVLEYVLGFFKRNQLNINLRDRIGETPLLMASRPITENHKAVKTLLKAGADYRIADRQGLTSFDLLLIGERNPELAWLHFDLGYDIHRDFKFICLLYPLVISEDPWLIDIGAELVIQEAMGVPIANTYWKKLCKYRTTRRYLRICREQLKIMRRVTFYEDLTFWDMLTADTGTLRKYAENYELVEAFFAAKCNGDFAFFCARVRYRLIDVMSQNNVKDLSTAVVCKLLKRPKMYEIMQHELTKYMDDDDFCSILSCCRKL